MQYSIEKIERELNAGGMGFEKGSVYDRFCKLTELRGVNGKRYELEGILTIVVLAKLCGEDKPLGIAEWAKHRKEELVKFLGLNWSRMPHHNTYRRILAYKVYEQEVAGLVGEYN
ncbi:MAG: transposase family protein, partial [Bacteroidota bacterium]